MKKKVQLIRCVCEHCETTVNENDKYCTECGHSLKEKVTYEEVPRDGIRK